MRIDQLIYLDAALRHGSMRAAAHHLNVAQPTISVQIQRLEEELGVVLIVRGPHGISPTYAAEAILPHLRTAVRAVQAMREEAGSIGGLRTGEVSLGTIPAGSVAFLPTVIAEFRNKYRHIHFQVTEAASGLVREGVLNGEHDLGILSRFASDSTQEKGLRYIDIADHGRLVLVLAADHPLVQRDRITVESLSGEPMIVFQEGSLLRDAYENLKAVVDVEPVYYTNMVTTALRMVQAGVGISIAHTLTLGDAIPPGVAIAPIDVPWAETRMSVVMRADEQPSPAARTLMRMLRDGTAAPNPR